MACPHDGTPLPGAEPSLNTQTLLPLASPTRQPGVTPQPTPPHAQSVTAQVRKPEAEQDPLVGRQLGEYVMRQRIGSGGMGVVYEGEHTTIGRKVAIKLIREEHANSPHARDLLTEARAASAIRHHGIIDVHGFGHQPGIGQFLVMEYLEGRPLNEFITERAPLPASEALPLLCEVLDALSAAHAVGVIHRDLKPSNIFVVRQSNGTEYIKVLDFGLAKRSAPDGTSAQTHSNLIVGTPQYMSPEQALADPVSPQTDLYAVGVIAFELLTGQRPFPGRSHMEVVAHHLKTPAPAPSSLVPQSPELDALVLRLLAKEPRQRPASASEVARELRALLPSQGSSRVSAPRTISRPIPAVKPTNDSAPVNAPTATLSPVLATSAPAATPAPAPEAPTQPPTRGSRRAWAFAVGGALTLALGVGALVSRGPTESAPVTAAPPTVTAPSTETRPPASQPEPEPQPPPAPAPTLVEAPKPAGTSPLPAKKKPLKPVQQPATTAAREPPPSAPEPAPQAISEHAPERNATGTLHLLVKGAWADVWIDGQKLGRVPPQNRYPLTAGDHSLELRNPNRAPYRQRIVIPANDTLPHTVDFTAPPQGSASSSP
jgi:serine/threonine-protein kinase